MRQCSLAQTLQHLKKYDWLNHINTFKTVSLSGFQSCFRVFWHRFVLAKLSTSSIRVNTELSGKAVVNLPNSRLIFSADADIVVISMTPFLREAVDFRNSMPHILGWEFNPKYAAGGQYTMTQKSCKMLESLMNG